MHLMSFITLVYFLLYTDLMSLKQKKLLISISALLVIVISITTIVIAVKGDIFKTDNSDISKQEDSNVVEEEVSEDTGEEPTDSTTDSSEVEGEEINDNIPTELSRSHANAIYDNPSLSL